MSMTSSTMASNNDSWILLKCFRSRELWLAHLDGLSDSKSGHIWLLGICRLHLNHRTALNVRTYLKKKPTASNMVIMVCMSRPHDTPRKWSAFCCLLVSTFDIAIAYKLSRLALAAKLLLLSPTRELTIFATVLTRRGFVKFVHCGCIHTNKFTNNDKAWLLKFHR